MIILILANDYRFFQTISLDKLICTFFRSNKLVNTSNIHYKTFIINSVLYNIQENIVTYLIWIRETFCSALAKLFLWNDSILRIKIEWNKLFNYSKFNLFINIAFNCFDNVIHMQPKFRSQDKRQNRVPNLIVATIIRIPMSATKDGNFAIDISQ